MAKRRRGAGAGPGPSRAMEREQRPQPEQELERRPHQNQKQRLYLVLDDNPFGYSIRRINLSPSTSRQTRSSRKKKKNTAASGGKCPVRRLPCPIFYTEAQRGLAATIAAIGTKILLTQCMNRFTGGDMVMVLQIYDVRHRGVTFGPGKFYDCPIYISIGDKLFALYNDRLSRLSFEQKQPPPLHVIKGSDDDVPWSWQQLPPPPFHRVDVTSYAVLPADDDVDGQTILVSNDDCPDDPWCTAGTFTFNTIKCEWTTHGDWTLPFTGRAYFVSSLEAFVGLSKDPATLGHLTSCDREAATATGPAPATTWKLSKEKLFSDDPAETHVSATFVYTGRGGGGSEFCLVQCVSVKPGNGNGNGNADDENLDEPCYRYRLTTFSLSYDDSGHLTTGNTCSVQCYKVPREATKQFMNGDPVAFWL